MLLLSACSGKSGISVTAELYLNMDNKVEYKVNRLLFFNVFKALVNKHKNFNAAQVPFMSSPLK